MSKRIIEILFVFFAQIIVLNHLDFSAYVYPQIFIVILINLPPYLKSSWQVIIAFILGLCADLFVSTPGLHASACLFLILIRMFMLKGYNIDDIVADRTNINVSNMPLNKYLIFCSILVFAYHLLVFGIESVGSLHPGIYLLTSIISSLLAVMLILLLQFVFYRRLSV